VNKITRAPKNTTKKRNPQKQSRICCRSRSAVVQIRAVAAALAGGCLPADKPGQENTHQQQQYPPATAQTPAADRLIHRPPAAFNPFTTKPFFLFN